MPTAPFVIAAAVVLAQAAWAIRLGVDGRFLAPSSAAALAGGLLIHSVVSAAGLLLARGRWARRLALGVTLVGLGLGSAVGLDGWGIPATALSLVAAAGLVGPWLDGWLRRLPAADGPGTEPMLLALGGAALLPAVGAASPGGLELLHGILAGAGLLLSWAYSRAHMWAVWGLRTAVLPIGIATAAVSPPAGAVLLTVMSGGLAALAWRRAARLAVDPVSSRLPSPRRARPGPQAPERRR